MNAPAPAPVDIAKRVEQYIKLRDKIADIKKQQAEELKKYQEALDKLNVMLLQHLISINSDSATVNGVGTVYRKERKSASIADGDEFRRFIIGGELWDLVDWKANPTATADFIQENGAPPPGVNYTTMIDVGVRRK